MGGYEGREDESRSMMNLSLIHRAALAVSIAILFALINLRPAQAR
jgi:hypothetical protein